MMIVLAITSIVYMLYSYYVTIKELIVLIRYDEEKGIELYEASSLDEGSDHGPLNDAHSRAHLSILLVFLLKSVLLCGYLIVHYGWDEFIGMCLIKHNGWLLLSVSAYAYISLTRHLKKERIGESHYLDMRKESGLQKIIRIIKSIFT